MAAVVLLVGCTPPSGPSPSPTTSDSPSPSASDSPSPSPTPTESPTPSAELPLDFPIEGSLIEGDNAQEVVEALHATAGDYPALKLDVTLTQATLTVLSPEEEVLAYRWSDDVIDSVATDFEYLEQATFDPADYPLDQMGRMFDVANLRGVEGDLIYQIQEYREGLVFQTISSTPESTTVFFLGDGIAVPDLGTTMSIDVQDGFQAVTRDAEEIYRFGLDPARGFYAEIPGNGDDAGILRTRMGAVPTFDTPIAATDMPEPFSPELIPPAVLSQLLSNTRSSPEDQCSLVVDKSHERTAPVISITCDGETIYADLDGRDITDLIEG